MTKDDLLSSKVDSSSRERSSYRIINVASKEKKKEDATWPWKEEEGIRESLWKVSYDVEFSVSARVN